jgi:protein SCO1/2
MAPLLVPFLLFSLLLSFSRDLVPKAELVLGKKVPDVQVLTSEGKTLYLSELSEGKPLMVSFLYTRCTSSCPLIVQRLKEALRNLPSEDYRVVLVDFDERDSVPDLRRFILDRSVPENWNVVLARGIDLKNLAGVLDFKFYYDEDTDMFAHPNVLVVLSPELKVTGYILGLSYDSDKLSEMIKRAELGEVDLNPIKGFLLKCFRYDPITGTYSIDWSFVAMILGGALPLLVMFYHVVWRNLLPEFLRRAPR